MSMSNIHEMLSQLSEGYWLNQMLTIICLFALGFLFMYLCDWQLPFAWHCLIAYPIGLCLWGLTGFALLVTGIPYKIVTILAVLFVCLLIPFIIKRGAHVKLGIGKLLFVTGVVAVLAALCVSGLLTVSVSNDSVYYYSVYPQAIVESGYYRASFDVFLTDVGQTTAIINCLPFFFGFDETFGIQHFFNLNFIAIFFLALYETLQRMFPQSSDRKKTILTAGLSALFLVTSTPFLVTSKWVLANVYFMDFMFLIFYLAWKFEQEQNKRVSHLVILGMLLALLSQMRMEGGMIACFLILCISCLKYTNKEMLLGMALPVGIMQISYYIMIFVRLSVDPLYSFLDIKKAAVMVVMLLGVVLYLLVFREKRWLFLTHHFKGLLLLGLLAGNVGLCIINPNRFITNLKCFGQNIILQNGWGYFGFVVLIFLLLLPITKQKLSYPDLFVLGYILFTIAVCWARGATLRIGIGDSGNRVMMQIVPFVVFDMTIHVKSAIMNESHNIMSKNK